MSANSVDPDQTPRVAASDPGLRFAQTCQSYTKGKSCIQKLFLSVLYHNYTVGRIGIASSRQFK